MVASNSSSRNHDFRVFQRYFLLELHVVTRKFTKNSFEDIKNHKNQQILYLRRKSVIYQSQNMNFLFFSLFSGFMSIRVMSYCRKQGNTVAILAGSGPKP